jgi:hypothetical protein
MKQTSIKDCRRFIQWVKSWLFYSALWLGHGWMGIRNSLRAAIGPRDVRGHRREAIELRDRAEQTADRVKDQVLGPLSSTNNLDTDYTTR